MLVFLKKLGGLGSWSTLHNHGCHEKKSQGRLSKKLTKLQIYKGLFIREFKRVKLFISFTAIHLLQALLKNIYADYSNY